MATLAQIEQLIAAKKKRLEDLKPDSSCDADPQLEADLEFLQTYGRLLGEAERL